MLRVRVAASSPVGLRVRRTWRFKGGRPPPSQGGDLPQRVAAHGRRPAYHGRSKATGRSRWQRISLVFADSTPRRFAADCHRLQPRGSIKAPYSARHENDFVCATLGGISLSEKRQLNGYRVRLRVVEEYDVALLAESHDDAKVRAEADLRRGDQFEDIQDSWPEEIVSVEALAVEPYPELE